MPWVWANDRGIVGKWADRYGIAIGVTQFNDCIESINRFTAPDYDAVALTNMDALSILAAGGVDTSVVVVNDYSNGNDMVLAKSAADVAGLKGRKIDLVELSVSHCLLARALDRAGLSGKDVTVLNRSDADMVAAAATPDVSTIVTWNPLASEVVAGGHGKPVFTSAEIPGEIMDLTAAKTDVLKDSPDFGKALAGIWCETVSIMTADTPACPARSRRVLQAESAQVLGAKADEADPPSASRSAKPAFSDGKP